MQKRTPEEKAVITKLTGYAAANIVAFVLIGVSYLITRYSHPGEVASILIFSEFVIVPYAMGFISAWCWRNLELTSRQLIWASVKNTILAVLLSAVFLQEGAICLIIVSPLLIVFILTGTFSGRAVFRKNNSKLNVSFFCVLLIAFVVDSTSAHHYQNMVADRIVINAPVNEVWKHVVAYKRIKTENKYWLFKIGMPSPVESTAEGYYLGAKRKCIFSNGYVFDEKIVTYEENKNLTFDITDQPRDPEIMGHIDILRGQFILKDNGDNTTTLTGNSWYRLYVFPVWYYDIWAKSITRNVHLRVMDHIKELSETK